MAAELFDFECPICGVNQQWPVTVTVIACDICDAVINMPNLKANEIDVKLNDKQPWAVAEALKTRKKIEGLEASAKQHKYDIAGLKIRAHLASKAKKKCYGRRIVILLDPDENDD